MQTGSDIQLLGRIAARDSDALSDLYDRFSKLLYGIILTVVRDTDEAEDVLQEVFIQIWRSAGTYQSALGTPKTWLVRMAHNRAIDLLRSKRFKQKKVEVGSFDTSDQEARPPADYVADTTWQTTLHHEQRGQISTALAQLPPEQRTLIDLAFLQGFTHQEIAQNTGIPLGTIKTRIRTGMQALRTHLRFVGEEI
ncbi:MAG TPA: sigma-70 family RNA polymerase sigma factor [Candidatus Kapabacteria bacterium]|nr:sigma-70 family RNA polymerase sigma factor [Candidatus Kapabacteria bacterium]